MFHYVIEHGHEAIVASFMNKENCNYIKRYSRTVIYTNSSATKSIDALPPASSVVQGLCVFPCQNVYNLVEEDRHLSLNPFEYGCKEHSGALFQYKCIMRCQQTF